MMYFCNYILVSFCGGSEGERLMLCRHIRPVYLTISGYEPVDRFSLKLICMLCH
jgi:hypothetical protein